MDRQRRTAVVAGCIGVVVLWQWLKARRIQRFKKVRGWPFIGIALELGRAGKQAVQRMEAWADEFADEDAFELTMFGVRFVCVRKWEVGKGLLEMRPSKFMRYRALDKIKDVCDGLFGKEGQEWRRQRQLIAPAFHTRNIPGYLPLAKKAVDGFVNMLRRSEGSAVNFSERLQRLTASTLMMVLAGRDLGVVDSDDPSRIVALVPKFFEALRYRMKRPFRYWKVLDLFGDMLPTTRIFKDMRARIDTIIEEEAKAGQPDNPTLLTKLMEAHDGDVLSNDELAGNVMQLFLGGTETTSSALSWAFYRLSHHPDLQDEIYEEAKRVAPDGAQGMEQLESLTLAKAVWLETLRVHSPVPMQTLTTLMDVDIAGRVVPQGTNVLVMHRYICRHSAEARVLGDDLDIWQPKRWVKGSGAHRGELHAFPPVDGVASFGHGARACVGRHLADMEGALAIAEVCRHVKLAACPFEVQEKTAFTCVPEPDVVLSLVCR